MAPPRKPLRQQPLEDDLLERVRKALGGEEAGPPVPVTPEPPPVTPVATKSTLDQSLLDRVTKALESQAIPVADTMTPPVAVPSIDTKPLEDVPQREITKTVGGTTFTYNPDDLASIRQRLSEIPQQEGPFTIPGAEVEPPITRSGEFFPQISGGLATPFSQAERDNPTLALLNSIGYAFEPLDIMSETIAESLAQIPKIATGRFGDVEAPTLFSKDPQASLESFKERPWLQQLGVSGLDPLVLFTAAKLGITLTKLTAKTAAGAALRVQVRNAMARPGMQQAAQQAGVTQVRRPGDSAAFRSIQPGISTSPASTQIALPPASGRTTTGAIEAPGRMPIRTEAVAPVGQPGRVAETIAATQTGQPFQAQLIEGVRATEAAQLRRQAPPSVEPRPLEASTPQEAAAFETRVPAPEVGRRTTLLPPEEVTTPVQARQELAKEFLEAIPDSPTDIAATAYLNTGKIIDYIRRVPKKFEVALGFVDEVFQEVGRVSAKMADPTRTIQAIDFGYFGGKLQQGLMWPTRQTFRASLHWGDVTRVDFRKMLERHGIRSSNPIRTRQKLDAAGDVLEEIGTNEVNVSNDILVGQVEHLLKGFSAPERLQIVGVAKDTRVFFDNVLRIQNAARGRRGQSAIPRLQNYRPWVRNTNLWSRAGFSDQSIRTISDSPIPPDFIKPNTAFNPRALQRLGGLEGYEKIRNIERLAFDYVETARKDIFYTNIIQNGKAHIRALRGKGLENSAASIEDWIMEAYAGKLPSLSKGIRENVPSPPLTGMLALRRSLTRAVFPLNWTWNAFVQTSSVSLTVKNHGVVSTLQGLDYLVNMSARKAVQKHAYSVFIKRRQGGRAALQDVGPGVGSTSEVQRSAVETVEGYANFLTNLLEDNLTGISVRAAYHDGTRNGLKGRPLWEYASEGGSKTQSMYNLEDAPGMLRTKEVGAIVPFQTFAFEIMNTVRELSIPGLGRFGATHTYRNRAVSLAHWAAMMVAFNMVGDKLNNRQPWQLSSFIPFWGLMTNGVDAGNPWNHPLPVKYGNDFRKGVTDYLKYGNWKRLRSWAIQYHMLGGTQINRTLKGIEAVADGEVTDVRGRQLFEVSPDDWKKAVSQGPYSTSPGREYIDKLNESKGPGYRYTGIPIEKNTRFWGERPKTVR